MGAGGRGPPRDQPGANGSGTKARTRKLGPPAEKWARWRGPALRAAEVKVAERGDQGFAHRAGRGSTPSGPVAGHPPRWAACGRGASARWSAEGPTRRGQNQGGGDRVRERRGAPKSRSSGRLITAIAGAGGLGRRRDTARREGRAGPWRGRVALLANRFRPTTLRLVGQGPAAPPKIRLSALDGQTGRDLPSYRRPGGAVQRRHPCWPVATGPPPDRAYAYHVGPQGHRGRGCSPPPSPAGPPLPLTG